MTVIPIRHPIFTSGRRCGLGGCLLGAGLLIASVHPGSAGIPAPGHVAVPAAQVQPAAQLQDPRRSDPAGNPSIAAPAANTPEPAVAVGFGWG